MFFVFNIIIIYHPIIINIKKKRICKCSKKLFMMNLYKIAYAIKVKNKAKMLQDVIC